MSASVIKNISHKFISSDLHIIYEPTYTIFDHEVFQLPALFFTTTPYLINRDNVIHSREVSLFAYDFIWTHGIRDIEEALKLHIPVMQYVHAYTATSIGPKPNVLSILEGAKDINTEGFGDVPVMVPSVTDIPPEKKASALIDCHYQRLDPNVVAFLKTKLPNLEIIDDINNLTDIRNYKVIIDLYPNDISNLLFALLHETFYITTPRSNTEQYSHLYNGVSLCATVLDAVDQHDRLLTGYNSSMFTKDKHKIEASRDSWYEQMSKYLIVMKRKGFYL